MTKVMTLDESRSYATVENLEKGLRKLGFADDRYILAYTKEGRVTAIFPISNITGDPERTHGGYLAVYAVHGFTTIG